MIQSYNTLKNTLEQFASNHLTLKRFKLSFFEQLDNFSTSDNTFPILYVIPSDVSFQENVDEFSFRVYCVDILQKDRANEGTILNETLLVLRDLNNWLRLETTHELNIIGTPRAIPVNNFLTEFTTGWYMDVVIESTPETSDCAIPFTDNFQYSGITCDSTYITQFLSCDTLADCASFIALEDRVTNLETIVYRTNELLSGGATFLSGLTYDVTPLEYVINGQFYSTASATQVTANSGDTNFDRIDLIIADINGVVSILEGTPSANPVQPDVDETTQVVVAILTVPAGATAIPIQETLVYNEDVGTPTEWNGTVTNASIDLAYTGITYNGTKSLRFNVTPNTAYAQFDSGTNFDTSVQNTIQFWVYNTVAWTSAHRLNIRLRNAANALVGSVVQLYNARYGFSATASSVGVWQLVSIPVADFNLTSPIIGRIDFQAAVTSGIGFSCIIDVVKFVEGASNASQTNKWWFVRGDTSTTITPTTTNSTLRLAGGSNINTYASGTNFINIGLNPVLTGITSVSATTYYGDGSNLTGIVSGGDSYWTAGTGTQAIITNNGTPSIASGNFALAQGYENTSSGNYSVSMGGYYHTATGKNSAVIGGQSNVSSGQNSAVIGGNINSATTTNSSVVGGLFNLNNGFSSGVIGGVNNRIGSIAVDNGNVSLAGTNTSVIGGGAYNSIAFDTKNSGIIGGRGNVVSGWYSFIGGGANGVASGYNSAVIGGSGNIGNGSHSFIGGGFENTSSGPYSFIGGGKDNTGSGYNSFIGGGKSNLASGYYSSVIGGDTNTASGNGSFVGGGLSNSATTTVSIVIGGRENVASGYYSSVMAGKNNSTSGNYSSIVGGNFNFSSGDNSFIGGGNNNNITNYNSSVIGGAQNNIIGAGSLIGSSKFSQIQGGYQNTILGGTQNIIQTGTYNTSIIGGTNNTINTGGYFTSIIGGSGNIVGAGYSSSVIGGSVNLTSGDYSVVIAGTNNTASGDRTVVIGGQNITGSANDTTYVPYLNIGSLSATTTATTYNNLVINTNGDVMTNNQFYIGVNFTVTGVTWDYVALNTFSIYSIDNPSSIGYSLLHNGTAYTLNNIINLYDDLQITGVTATGVLKLNATL
jgi:hypothetical protein